MFAQAVTALKNAEPILLYDFDDREAETDLIFLGKHATPTAVRDLRTHAGAPLSVYISSDVGEKLGLQTYTDFVKLRCEENSVYAALAQSSSKFDPRFSVTLDFRENRTGCSHVETSRTILELVNLIELKRFDQFSRLFRSPGHVPLIIASPRLLKDRVGHTELIMALLRANDLSEVAVASEMIDPGSGKSADVKFARDFARRRNLNLILGKDVLDAYRSI
jgi:3,4-dihydroxy 2-butanone 4-phosphate synthase